MKPARHPKLVLNRERIRVLTDVEVGKIAGAPDTTAYCSQPGLTCGATCAFTCMFGCTFQPAPCDGAGITERRTRIAE